MANTYTKIYIHAVFAVKYRECLIAPHWKDELFKYTTGIVQNNSHKMLAIGGMPDHVHLFVGMKPDQSVSDLIRDVKANTSKWINERGLVKGKFSWQAGFGAFSYAQSQLDTLVKYVMNQENHHRKQSFREEYQELLKKFDVEYDERYIMNEVEEVYGSLM